MMFRCYMFFLILSPFIIFSQEMISVEGAVTLQNTQNGNPVPGTIRWTGSDFEGWNGLAWVSLTGGNKLGTLADYDGNIYKTVQIGGQTWMVENLNVSHLNDGTFIKKPGQITLPGAITGRFYYDDDEANYGSHYGALYQWNVVSSGKLCPQGWHVPTTADWDILGDFAGGSTVAGGRLKTVGSAIYPPQNPLWQFPNIGAENAYSFSVLPGGYKYTLDGMYYNVGKVAQFWSSTVGGLSTSYGIDTRVFKSNTGEMIQLEVTIYHSGYSVRCIKD